MNKKEKRTVKKLKILLWVTFSLFILTGITLCYFGFLTNIYYLKGFYRGAGTKGLCDGLNKSMSQSDKCILGEYYNEDGEFNRYRHNINCSWGDFDIGVTYKYLSYVEQMQLWVFEWLFECEYMSVTEIEQPYTIYLMGEVENE